jgi:hypothetical protein
MLTMFLCFSLILSVFPNQDKPKDFNSVGNLKICDLHLAEKNKEKK